MTDETGNETFSRPNREAKIFDLEQFQLFSADPGNGQRSARLQFGERNGAPRITIFTGLDTVKVIGIGMAPAIFEMFLTEFRKIADEVGAYLVVDMAHFAGLVAAGFVARALAGRTSSRRSAALAAAAASGGDARIAAFEPTPEVAALLRASVAENGFAMTESM